MEIYLFRHGIAEDGEAGAADSARELTDEGRRKVAGVVRLARTAGLRPSLILTSPYTRARQTAQIAADELEYKGHIVAADSLVPYGAPEGAWNAVREHGDESSVLLAGHEPHLSRLTAYLLNTPALRLDMKKAEIVRIDVETVRARPHGSLRWMITPKMIS